MKVAYINTVFAIKSTGRTYLELKNALESQGHECRAFYGVGDSSEPNTYRIGNRFSYLTHNLLSRITGLEGYFSYFATKKLIRQLRSFDADIFHLGCLHGHYLHLPALFKYLRKEQKPVFITTHDCWCFTGKCTHFTSFKCDKYKTHCNSCLSMRQYPKSYFFDFSRKMFGDKKKWFLGLKHLNVICVSNWIKQQVENSYFANKTIAVNYNWINTELFRPISKNMQKDIRLKNGVCEDDFLIIAVSSFWSAGTPKYVDLMKLINKLEGKQKLLVVGHINNALPRNERVIYIPFVSDVSNLAKLYAISDVYVHLSVEDTFGKVIAEAQACGTPAIVYDATACPEISKIGDGYVVPPRDVEAIFEVIRSISNKSPEESGSERKSRAEKTKQMLSKNVCVEKLMGLYTEALKGQMNREEGINGKVD